MADRFERQIGFDLVQEDGGWQVDDIRGPVASPKPWDVRQILEDAGIK